MSVNYNPTAPEVLHFLGFQGALNTVEKFQVFEKEHGILLPPRLWDFLDVAAGNPLLGGTELWMDPRWYCTLYEELSTQLDSDSEDWETAVSGERAEAGFYGYSRIPREKWPETLPDRLLIGSDDCGIVTYGIRLDALAEDDPEVAWIISDISFMVVFEKYMPIFPFGRPAFFAVFCPHSLVFPIMVNSRICRVVKCVQHTAVSQAYPYNFAFPETFMDLVRKLVAFLLIITNHAMGSLDNAKRPEKQINCFTDPDIAVFDDPPAFIVQISDWKGFTQFPPFCFIHQPAPHPFLQEMQFCLAHRTLKPQQETVVKIVRIINTVCIDQ